MPSPRAPRRSRFPARMARLMGVARFSLGSSSPGKNPHLRYRRRNTQVPLGNHRSGGWPGRALLRGGRRPRDRCSARGHPDALGEQRVTGRGTRNTQAPVRLGSGRDTGHSLTQGGGPARTPCALTGSFRLPPRHVRMTVPPAVHQSLQRPPTDLPRALIPPWRSTHTRCGALVLMRTKNEQSWVRTKYLPFSFIETMRPDQ